MEYRCQVYLLVGQLWRPIWGMSVVWVLRIDVVKKAVIEVDTEYQKRGRRRLSHQRNVYDNWRWRYNGPDSIRRSFPLQCYNTTSVHILLVEASDVRRVHVEVWSPPGPYGASHSTICCTWKTGCRTRCGSREYTLRFWRTRNSWFCGRWCDVQSW